MTERTCQSCAWWNPTEDEPTEPLPCMEGTRKCRYKAPDASMGFPCTLANDWCRHWSAATVQEEKWLS